MGRSLHRIAQKNGCSFLRHNITPPEFFERWDAEMARICRVGREELAGLAGQVELALADSGFNRRELERLASARTGVLPIYLDFARYREQPNPVLRRLLADDRTNLLFVGRVAPNKRDEDLIRVASCWRRFTSPDVRLVLPGKLPGRGRYFDALQGFYYEQGFAAEEVLFLGHVSHDELLACYASAHVFLSMSEHEGFGVPLVESMVMDLPILAYRCTAVADTLGEAGLQFETKDFELVAELAHQLSRDLELRGQVLAGQRRRLPALAPETVEATLRAVVEAL